MRRTPAEVATYLRDFIDGTGENSDWDDFTSISIADPRLDSIRKRALAIELPVDSEGMLVLGSLYQEASHSAATD